MSDDTIINLGVNGISLKILPVWKCKVLFEQSPRCKLTVSYYLNGQNLSLYKHVLDSFYLHLDVNLDLLISRYPMSTAIYSIYLDVRLGLLINAMEKNISYDSRGMKWNTKNNILTYIISDHGHAKSCPMVLNNFELCTQSKKQFIEEFKYLNTILLIIYNKKNICHSIQSLLNYDTSIFHLQTSRNKLVKKIKIAHNSIAE